MFCLLVSPDPLRRALLLSKSDSEQPNPASTTAVIDGGASPATLPAVSHHVAVDIRGEDGEDSGGGGGEDPDAEELKTTQHMSPLHRALVRAVFVASVFAAPPLVTTAFTRSSSFLLALVVVVLVALTVLSLFMATLCVYEDEDREREEAEQGDG